MSEAKIENGIVGTNWSGGCKASLLAKSDTDEIHVERPRLFSTYPASLHASRHSPWRRPRGLQAGNTGACHLQQKAVVRSQCKIELKLKAAHSPLQRVTNHARPRPAHVLSLAASIRLRRPAPPRARFWGRRLARFAHDPTALIVDVPRPEIIASLCLSALFACELIAPRR